MINLCPSSRASYPDSSLVLGVQKTLISTFFALSLLLLCQPAHTNSEQIDPALKQALQLAINSPNNFEDKFDAQVWLQDMSNRLTRFVDDPVERIALLKTIHFEAGRVNLEPELVLAVIEVESHFDQFAISVSGARGLMQVMPFWLEEIQLSNKNLFKLQTNIRMGCTILRFYLDKESGDIGPALARYNGSYGKTKYPNKVIKALNTHWFKQ